MYSAPENLFPFLNIRKTENKLNTWHKIEVNEDRMVLSPQNILCSSPKH